MAPRRDGRWFAALTLGVLLAGCASGMRDQTTAEFLEDSVITSKVKARLAQEPGVSALAISVDTYNGVVVLQGFVDDEAQRGKAVAAVRSVAGVRDVRGEGLIVKPQRPGG